LEKVSESFLERFESMGLNEILALSGNWPDAFR